MDKFIRKKVDIDKDKPIVFQVREWYSGDIKQDDDADSEDEDSDKKFQIYMFGVTQDGNTVCINIKNFKAFFYLKVRSGEEWNDFMVKQFKGLLKKRLGKKGKYLTGCKLLFRKDVYGFNNHKKFAFLKLSFSNLKVMSGCKWGFKKKKYKFDNFTIDRLLTNKLYNANLDPILTFVHRNDILTAGWIEVNKYQIPEISMSRCQIYAETSFKFVLPYDKEDIAPMVTLSFDIECMSTRPKKFPDPTIKGDAVIQIGSSFQREGDPEIVKHVITLGPCDPIEGVIVEYYDTEAEVLEAWCELIKATDPDQLIGYNIFGFDWVYLWKRAVKVGCEDVFTELSRLIHVPSKMAEKQMSSNAYGHNEFIYLDMHGVGQIDLLHIVRREHKLTSYKLDNVASVFLGDKKHDVTPEMIFKMAGPEGTSAERAVVADYCAQDTALPLRLMKRLSILPNLLEMAKITRVPVFWLIVRGQQIKVFSQLVYEGGKDGFLVPTLEKKKKNIEQDKFVGATVLSAERGAYFEPVAGLDFASLYPSIMIAHNLCFSTFVMKEKYDNIKDVKYLHKKWEAGDYKFAQNVEGLLPKMLKKLWAARKVAKKQMKNAPTPELKAVYNGKQLAIKVSMNSIYGFTGASTGMLPCKPIASTTTTIGRGMIQHSKNCAESWYDGSEDSNGVKAHVVYGDTDSIYTKFTLPGQSEMDHETLMKEQFRVATECAERISETFIKPIELEMEKVMYPFLLFSKKRYACLYYEVPEKPKGIDCKGIQVVRRDNCPLVKDICNPVLDKIMYDKDIPGAEKIASDGVKRLLENKVPIEKLVLSKTLKKGYRCSVCHALDNEHYCKECLETYRKEHNNPNIKKENPDFLEYCWKNCKCEDGFIGSRLVTASMISRGDNNGRGINEEVPVDIRHYHKLKMIDYRPVINLPHVGLVKRMYKRDPMTAPQAGERVQYMFIENSNKNALQADRVENPIYAAKNPDTCKPDVLYYLERQLQSPLITLFELIVTDKNGKKFPDTPEGKRAAEREVARRLWKEAKRKKINALNGNQDIRNFFKLK
jgi:DNA polymerase delta subunit 1